MRQRDQNDMIEPIDRHEPIDSSEPNDAIDPTDRAEPTEPIDKTEPLEAIDRTEFSDHSDHLLLSQSAGIERDGKPEATSCGQMPTLSRWPSLLPAHRSLPARSAPR
jgi:hypothetical protein